MFINRLKSLNVVNLDNFMFPVQFGCFHLFGIPVAQLC